MIHLPRLKTMQTLDISIEEEVVVILYCHTVNCMQRTKLRILENTNQNAECKVQNNS